MKKRLALATALVFSIIPYTSFADHLEPDESEIKPGGNLSSTRMIEYDLSDTDLSGANFSGADLTDADLTGAVVLASLTGVVWSSTICPDGTNSDDNGDTCVNNL